MWTITDAVWRQSKGVFTKSQNTFLDGVRGQGRRSSRRWEGRGICLKTWCSINFDMFKNWNCKLQLPEDRSPTATTVSG